MCMIRHPLAPGIPNPSSLEIATRWDGPWSKAPKPWPPWREVEYGFVVDGTLSAAMPGLVWSWVGKCRSDGPPEHHGPGNVG